MKKITVGVLIAAVVIVIIILSYNVGNPTSTPTLPSSSIPGAAPVTPTNVTLPSVISHKHFDLSLDEKLKFKT